VGASAESCHVVQNIRRNHFFPSGIRSARECLHSLLENCNVIFVEVRTKPGQDDPTDVKVYEGYRKSGPPLKVKVEVEGITSLPTREIFVDQSVNIIIFPPFQGLTKEDKIFVM